MWPLLFFSIPRHVETIQCCHWQHYQAQTAFIEWDGWNRIRCRMIQVRRDEIWSETGKSRWLPGKGHLLWGQMGHFTCLWSYLKRIMGIDVLIWSYLKRMVTFYGDKQDISQVWSYLKRMAPFKRIERTFHWSHHISKISWVYSPWGETICLCRLDETKEESIIIILNFNDHWGAEVWC